MGAVRHRRQFVDDPRRRRTGGAHLHPDRLHRPRSGAQPGVRHTPAQPPARPSGGKRAHRAELRLVGAQAQRPPCASQRGGPRPRPRRGSPPGRAGGAGKRAPPARVVDGTLGGAALLPAHAAAKRGFARPGGQAAMAAARPRRGDRRLSHRAACRAVPDRGAAGALPGQGAGVHRRPAGGLLGVPGLQLRAQPQGDAAHRSRSAGLLRPPGRWSRPGTLPAAGSPTSCSAA